MFLFMELEKGWPLYVMALESFPSRRPARAVSKVVMLSDGYPIFTGQTDQVMDYLESIGFVPVFNFVNPADFLLDLANGK